METPAKSSFLQRRISKQDAIIQLFRPMLGNRVSNTLHLFDTLVTEAETLTKLGTKLQAGKEVFFLTPHDLKENLDEYGELHNLATKGRKLLNELGYVSRVRTVPITGEGSAPVGKNVQVQPITVTHPGSEPLAGAVVTAKPKVK